MGFGHSLPVYCHDYNAPQRMNPSLRMGDRLRVNSAKHLVALRERPSLRFRVTPTGSSWRRRAQVGLIPDGRLLVQDVNQADDFSNSAFTMPALPLTGCAANS
jgi:hypothetical protein